MSLTDVVPQRMAALDLANQVRSERAQLKRRLSEATRRDALLTAAAIVEEDPPQWVRSMEIGALIAACRSCGPRAAMQLLGALQPPVSPKRRIDELTFKRRHQVAAALRSKARTR